MSELIDATADTQDRRQARTAQRKEWRRQRSIVGLTELQSDVRALAIQQDMHVSSFVVDLETFQITITLKRGTP